MNLMMLVPTSKDKLNSEANMEGPRIEHNCKVPPEWDELNSVIEGNGICAQARRWFRRKCLISRKHPDTHFHLRSTAAISYEYARHATSYIHMVHPFSEFRIWWESMMIVTTVLALLIIPYRITFFFELPYGEWFLITMALNCVFVVDIVLWFFTGYHNQRTNVIVLEMRLVARKYITTWFLVDLLSSLPMELFALLARETPTNVQLYSYSQIIRIFRLRLVIVYGRRLRRVYNMSFQMHKSLELVLVMIILVHWMACAEYYIPATVRRLNMQSGKTHENWTSLLYLQNETMFFKYIISLYRAVAALVCSLKYDPMVALEDVIFDVILSIFGRMVNIYLIAQWYQLLNTFRGAGDTYLRLVPQLREYMRHKELPIEIQNRLTTYYEYCAQRGIDLERSIMSQISSSLKEELMLHRYRKLVEKVSFFKCLPSSVVTRIVMSLRTEVFLTNDVIIKAGTTGDSMYFIASGTVALYSSLGKEVCHLEDGAHFGEVSLIMENEPRVASVVAVEICEIYVLSREDFQQAIERYPNLMIFLQKIVLERLEKTLFLGDLYRLEGNIPEVFHQQRLKPAANKQKNKNWNYLYSSTFIYYFIPTITALVVKSSSHPSNSHILS